MNSCSKIFLVLCVAVMFGACDNAIESAYNEQLVVGAFIYANEPIDSVVLHRTTPFGSYYDDLDYAVDSAIVTVSVDGVTDTLLPAALKGRYYLPASRLIVQPGKTYTLSVTAPNHQTGGLHHLTSVTTVPEPIHFDPQIDSLRGQTFTYDTTNLYSFAFLVTAGPAGGPDQRYLLSVTALDTSHGRVRFRSDTTAPVRTRYSNVATGPSIAVTARFFSYYGPNRITFYAIDTNWTDYQLQLAFGGSPFGQGNFQPTLNHVSGGMGVFGSAARDTMTIWIKPKS